MADYVVTEAGFGADLGAEKFVDIKCRKSGLVADAAVLVATVRAVKYHGGVARDNLGEANTQAVKDGFANVRRHLHNLHEHYGLPAVVALNRFSQDADDEVQTLKTLCAEAGADMIVCQHWAEGGKGAAELAEKIVRLTDADSAMKNLYADSETLEEKVHKVAQTFTAPAVWNIPAKQKLKLILGKKNLDTFRYVSPKPNMLSPTSRMTAASRKTGISSSYHRRV